MEKIQVFQPPAQVRRLMLKKQTDTVTIKAFIPVESGVIMLYYNWPGDLHNVSHRIHIFPLMSFQWLITACKQVIQYDSPNDSDERI